MTSKELKKILVEQRKEYQKYLGTLAEDFDSKLSIIAESTLDLQKQMIKLQQQMVIIREMVAKNTEDMEIIKTDLDLIKNQLKIKVDIDEFAALERRVVFLEKRR